MFALAERRAQRAITAPTRSALVAKRPVHYGFARMFQMLNDNPRIQIRIFATAEARPLVDLVFGGTDEDRAF